MTRGRPYRRLVAGATVATVLAILLAGCGQSTRAQWSAAGSGSGASVRSGAPSTGTSAGQGATAGAVKPPYEPGKVLLGAYLDLKGQTEQQALALREQQLGRDLRVLHLYYDWASPMPQSPPAAGTILMISWGGTSYAPILNGSQDALIAAAADALAGLKAPVFLRWAWEMNGNWFDWDGAHNGNNPAGYIKAWKHIHDIFVAHHALNVAWVWGPNAGSVPGAAWNDMNNYYPGDDYVDWVAVSGYSTGRDNPDSLFGDIVKRYGSRKPIMIAETGALERGGTVKADWIKALQAWVIAHPAVGALVWFDTDNDKGTDKNWRIDSSASSLAAYRALADDPHFQE